MMTVDEALICAGDDWEQTIVERILSDEVRRLRFDDAAMRQSMGCQTCANRGQIDGLSQETHCEHCCYQPRIGRKNHYVEITK